jgi:hypothetical protein
MIVTNARAMQARFLRKVTSDMSRRGDRQTAGEKRAERVHVMELDRRSRRGPSQPQDRPFPRRGPDGWGVEGQGFDRRHTQLRTGGVFRRVDARSSRSDDASRGWWRLSVPPVVSVIGVPQ